MTRLKIIAPIAMGCITLLLPRLFGLEAPNGLSFHAWIYFSIFIGLIIGLILEPIPPALIGVIAVTIVVVCKVGPKGSGSEDTIIKASDAINWGLSGFSNAVVWLIFAAFTIGLGFSKTGLGERIALYLVSKLGRSSLGLGYAVAIVDGVLAPFIPSNAARSGGSVYPIVTSIAPMFDSYPDKNPRKIGAYLVWVGLASACVSSSIFLTGQAPNPLALSQIHDSGVAVVDWLSWFLAFLPVGVILFIITPILAYFIFPPEVKGSHEVVSWAKKKYDELGRITKPQIFMIIIALIGLGLWVGEGFFKINATTTALVLIVLMCATRVIDWQDFLGNKAAWGTLVWFATLVTMAGGLSNVGFLKWLASIFDGTFENLSNPTLALICILLFFSWLRYFFASGTAYVTAVMVIFIALIESIPSLDTAQTMLILILPMGFMGVITPYGTGCSPLWFGSHYVKGAQFFLLGGIFAAIYMLIYIVIGIPYIEYIVPKLGLL